MSATIYKGESAQFYECGYSCDHGLLLDIDGEKTFITDGRYVLEAQEAISDGEIFESRQLIKAACSLLRKKNVARLLFDPAEFNVSEHGALSRYSGCYLHAKHNFHQKRRIIKSDQEVELIRQSTLINKKAFAAFARYLTEKGVGQEEWRLHFEAQNILKDRGRYSLSFDPIVAINATAAKPHALPSKKKLKEGDLLLLDAGVKYQRYCSDRSRTAAIGESVKFGKKQKFADKKKQKIYDIVRKAQEHAITHARSGMQAREVDALARNVIDQSGYASYFVHSTGHGIGLDIHELPVISPRSDTVIEDGMVFTIEPGIYLPNRFGVRIEDIVVMRDGRAEVL